MDLFILAFAITVGVVLLNVKHQKRRSALLGHILGDSQIELLIEKLTQGYLRAVSETDAARRDQIWALIAKPETVVATEMKRFADDFAQVSAASARVSKLPVGLPWATQLPARFNFDLREALQMHARGIADAVANHAGRSLRDKAFVVSAEIFLMQHTCHWYCRSRHVASVRLFAHHQTRHDQVLAAVSPETRKAYGALTGF